MMARVGSPPACSTVALENAGIGLLHRKRILAADRGEAAAEPQGVEEAFGQPFKLVGADRQAMARLRQRIQRRLKPRKRPGAVGDVLGIMRDERPVEGIHVSGRGAAAFQDQSFLDHAAGATADQRAGPRRTAPWEAHAGRA